MSRTYKIHPAIGVARLGNSPSFFVAAETLFGTPFEIIDGREVPVEKFKDPAGRVKKQAARFRIYEYDGDTPVREITADDAEITWSVTLANTKGSAKCAPIPAGGADNMPPRNEHVGDRKSLEITPGTKSISGRNGASGPLRGKFLGADVAIGELRTDGAGRLLVLGADGESKSPTGRELGFGFNNDEWYDDTADGPVTATLRFSDRTVELTRAQSAWVLTNSPDFAPEVDPFVSLYDIAFDVAVAKGWLPLPEKPSFRNHIHPILQPAAAHRWVELNERLGALSTEWARLSSHDTPRPVRAEIEQTLLQPGLVGGFSLTNAQKEMIGMWVDNEFIDDWNTPPDITVTPASLDRAHLARTSGSSFYPGIEASRYTMQGRLYVAPFRIAPAVHPGELTERMSLPWQTDYAACRVGWWPAQRPNSIFVDPNRPERRTWTTFGAKQMLYGYRRLGFIVPTVNDKGKIVFVEAERDPSLPHDIDVALDDAVLEKEPLQEAQP